MKDEEGLRRLRRKQFPYFLAMARREARTNVPYVRNLADDVIADAVAACLGGSEPRTIINAPQLQLDAVVVAVSTALFALAHHPTWQIALLGGSRAIVEALSVTLETLRGSAKIRDVFPNLRSPVRSQGPSRSPGGGIRISRFGASIGRIDFVILVEPQSAADARDQRSRKEAIAYHEADIAPRVGQGGELILTARVQSEDLCGHLKGAASWRRVSLSAIARSEETWTLSDGRTFARQPRDLLNPQLYSRDDLKQRLFELGASNFTAQMLQEPVERERRTGTFIENPFDTQTWTPEMGVPHLFMGSVAEIDYLLHELFDGPKPPARKSEVPQLTDEQWEQAARVQQTRLIAQAQAGFNADFPEELPPAVPR